MENGQGRITIGDEREIRRRVSWRGYKSKPGINMVENVEEKNPSSCPVAVSKGPTLMEVRRKLNTIETH